MIVWFVLFCFVLFCFYLFWGVGRGGSWYSYMYMYYMYY